MRTLLSCFFMILKKTDLENVCPSVRWNLRRFCVRIDCGWQISYSRFWKFATPKWNLIIWKTKNFFLNFLLHFLNLHQILTILKEKVIVIGNVFSKLQTVKIFLRKLSQEHRFRTGFGSQHMKASQMLAKFPWERFYHVFWSFSVKLIWKVSPLVLGQILGVFVKTLTSDGKYLVQGSEKLQLSIHMQLFEKQKTFSPSFFPFLDSPSKFEYFEWKDHRHSQCASWITDCENLC